MNTLIPTIRMKFKKSAWPKPSLVTTSKRIDDPTQDLLVQFDMVFAPNGWAPDVRRHQLATLVLRITNQTLLALRTHNALFLELQSYAANLAGRPLEYVEVTEMYETVFDTEASNGALERLPDGRYRRYSAVGEFNIKFPAAAGAATRPTV